MMAMRIRSSVSPESANAPDANAPQSVAQAGPIQVVGCAECNSSEIRRPVNGRVVEGSILASLARETRLGKGKMVRCKAFCLKSRVELE
jgi:hypothetical protein